MKESNRKPYPNDVYIVYDDEYKAHLYLKDPLKIKSENAPSYSFDELVLEHMDNKPSTKLQPYIIRFMIYKVVRGETLDASTIEKIRRKEVNAHLEDLDGSLVELATRHNPDPVYFLSAIVYNGDGSILETRKYAPTGECSDKQDIHRLVIKGGLLEFEREEEPMPKDVEEQEDENEKTEDDDKE